MFKRLAFSLLPLIVAIMLPSIFSIDAFAAECPTGSVANNCAPGWEVFGSFNPTNLAPGSTGELHFACV